MVIHSMVHIRMGAMGWTVIRASVTNELFFNLIQKPGQLTSINLPMKKVFSVSLMAQKYNLVLTVTLKCTDL